MRTLSAWAEATPDAVAVSCEGGARSFAELDAAANRLARTLRRHGLVAGDAVALVCGNRPEFAEVYFACQRAGLRLTPINWHLAEDEVAYIVSDCEARALVVDATIAAPVDAARRSPGIVVALAVGGARTGFGDYDAEVGGEDAGALDDPATGSTMLYTSGTTGRPKGVYRPRTPTTTLTTANLAGYDPDGGDVHLCTGPLYHAAPLAFSLGVPLAWGATVVVMDRFDAERALALVESARVTHTHMVPTMFHRLLSLPDETRDRYDLSSLRFVFHGAAPCPVAVKRGMLEWLGPIIWEYYAATEGVGSVVDPATWLAHPGTVGRPLTPDQVLVGDEDGRPLAVGEVGLLYLKAPAEGRFAYYRDDDKTRDTYRGDYFTLGDVGYLDHDGFLYLTDRTANVIITGGVNVYPAEVDAVLLEHPAVGDAATIGVPDEEWGERVLAVVEPREGVTPSDELARALIEHCRQRIAHYKCPRDVAFTNALPRQDNGKVYKRLLREHYRTAAATGLDAEVAR
jgi:long-chain acyl-CoA synthetase